MPDAISSIPIISNQPPTVDFIDNHLPKHHPAFANPPVKYDPISDQFIMKNNATVMATSTAAALLSSGSLQPRQAWDSINVMKHWQKVLSESMAKFRLTPEPKDRSKPYDIRSQQDWNGICDKLEAARTKYEQKGGPVGSIRRGWRKVADSITPVAEATKIVVKVVPSNPYSTPVLGAVQIILDAVKNAARVRNRILKSFDNLIRTFADVEFLINTYPDDMNIWNKSVDLTVAVLDAVEKAIDFFIKSDCSKVVNAFLQGSDYENKLLECLDTISKSSLSLVCEEGLKSLIYQSNIYYHLSLGTQHIIQQTLQEVDNRVQVVDDRVQGVDIRVQGVDNRVQGVDNRVQGVDNRVQGVDNRVQGVDNRVQGVDNRVQGVDDRVQGVDDRVQGVNIRVQEVDNRVQEVDNRVQGVDYRVRAVHNIVEEVGNNYCDTLNCIKGLLSDYRNMAHKYDAERELRVELEVENRVLRAISPFPQAWRPPPPSSHTQVPDAGSHISQQDLRRFLNTPDIEIADIGFIADRKALLPGSQRAQAEQITNSPDFRRWIVAPFSAKLLVQWDNHLPKTVAGVSPLSVFCTTMAQALRADDRFISVLWFCGRYLDRADPRESGHAMLASLLDQLLRAYRFDMWALCRDIDLGDLEGGSHDALVKLLGCLVRQLPPAITLFCIIDGVALLERKEVPEDALHVLCSLISLTNDTSVPVTVKVLFTSTPGTNIVRAGFENDPIIEVSTLPRLALPASEERMARELGAELNEGDAGL